MLSSDDFMLLVLAWSLVAAVIVPPSILWATGMFGG